MIYVINVWDSDIANNIKNLYVNYEGVTKIVIQGANEYLYNTLGSDKFVLPMLIDFAKKHGIEVHIITGSPPLNKLMEEYDHVKIHNWGTFWLTVALQRLLASGNYEINHSMGLDVRDYEVGKYNAIMHPYITMNKAPKIHRAVMMDMLAKNNIIDDGVVIWREWCHHYVLQYWKQEIKLRDQIDQFVCQEQFPEEYAHSFMQLVTETVEDAFFLTEKTAMPLFFNKPFLVASCMNYHKFLSDLGFKLYDELFDYSFDNEPDIITRYDMIAQNVSRYVDKTPDELNTIYQSVHSKCMYNKRLAMRIATTGSLIPDIWNELASHDAENNINSEARAINTFIKNNEHEFRL